MTCAGAVDQSPQSTAVGCDVECGAELLRIGDVGGGEGGVRAEVVGDRRAIGGWQVDERHQPTGIRNPLGGGQSQARRPAGDGDRLSFEFNETSSRVVRGCQMSSTMVVLAMPPASHIDCRPYRIPLSRM